MWQLLSLNHLFYSPTYTSLAGGGSISDVFKGSFMSKRMLYPFKESYDCSKSMLLPLSVEKKNTALFVLLQ